MRIEWAARAVSFYFFDKSSISFKEFSSDLRRSFSDFLVGQIICN